MGQGVGKEIGLLVAYRPVPARCWVRSGGRGLPDGICWFVDDACEMIARAFALAALIGEAGVPTRKVATRRPGTILYRHPWQIVAKPEAAAATTWHLGPHPTRKAAAMYRDFGRSTRLHDRRSSV